MALATKPVPVMNSLAQQSTDASSPSRIPYSSVSQNQSDCVTISTILKAKRPAPFVEVASRKRQKIDEIVPQAELEIKS